MLRNLALGTEQGYQASVELVDGGRGNTKTAPFLSGTAQDCRERKREEVTEPSGEGSRCSQCRQWGRESRKGTLKRSEPKMGTGSG